MQKIIDLTLELTNKMLVQDAFQSNIYVTMVSHEESKAFKTGPEDDPFTSTWNYLGMVEHTGTHVDAFFHMTPDGLPIDQMPLDLFFGKAVCLDMRHIPARGSITVQDLEQAEQEAGVTIDGHIVLLATGVHDKYFPSKDILFMNPDISPEAVAWLASRRSRMHGVEGPSTDIMDTQLFPSHRACRDLGLSHYEWLVNLNQLVGKGEFQFYGIPLRLKNGSGSPVRAFAVIDE